MHTTRYRSLLSVTLLCLMGQQVHALDISGASTIQPLVARLAPAYQAKTGDAVKLSGGGSGAGIKDALSGKSGLGMVSRALSDSEKTTLKHTTVGIDALALLVHQSNPVEAISKAQVVDLYSGKVTNWRELGGPDLPVVRVSKEVGRSTLELFEHYSGLLSPDRKNAGDKPRIHASSHVIGANVEALMLVGGLPGAVGYASFGDAQLLKAAGMPIKVLKLDGVEPSTQTFLNRSYPIVRELNLVYATETPAVTDFLSLALSAEGQAAVKALGFVPMSAQ